MIDYDYCKSLGAKYLGANSNGELIPLRDRPELVDGKWITSCDKIKPSKPLQEPTLIRLFETPKWLTKEIEVYLIRMGLCFLACEPNGVWYAFRGVPYFTDRWTASTLGRMQVYNEQKENPNFRESLIALERNPEDKVYFDLADLEETFKQSFPRATFKREYFSENDEWFLLVKEETYESDHFVEFYNAVEKTLWEKKIFNIRICVVEKED